MTAGVPSDVPWLKVVGWLGQACFFSRFLVQWIVSERRKESTAPRAFWWLSFAGAVLSLTYALSQRNPVFSLGYLATGLIYVRNIVLSGGRRRRTLNPAWVLGLAVLGWVGLVWVELLDEVLAESAVWMTIGFVGQAVWGSRFLVQWWHAERVGRGTFPESFWWLSLVGNALLLGYAIRLGDPIWIAGLSPGPLVQVRNLWLIHASRGQAPAGSSSRPG